MTRFSALKKINDRIHWEVKSPNSTNEQARDYCFKEGNFQEFGALPPPRGAVEKNRWADAKRACQEGRLEDVPEDIYFRYYRTCKEIKKDHMPKPDDADDVSGVYIWGPPGTGKSRKARADYPGAYLKMQNKWWDGYQDEEFVILDDLDSKELGHLLKIWCDRYSFVAETKGGAIAIRPKKIVITSNYSIEQLWAHDSAMMEAIRRRCEVIYMGPAVESVEQY